MFIDTQVCAACIHVCLNVSVNAYMYVHVGLHVCIWMYVCEHIKYISMLIQVDHCVPIMYLLPIIVINIKCNGPTDNKNLTICKSDITWFLLHKFTVL